MSAKKKSRQLKMPLTILDVVSHAAACAKVEVVGSYVGAMVGDGFYEVFIDSSDGYCYSVRSRGEYAETLALVNSINKQKAEKNAAK